MSIPFTTAQHLYTVTAQDRPAFEGEVVHNVCSTYALAREFEWAGRRVYLANRPVESEAIGTQVEVIHKASAPVGAILSIEATPTSYEKDWLVCRTTAFMGDTLIAEGTTTQKIRAGK